MAELSGLEPTRRFWGLSDNYARFRPHYPDAALDHAFDRCGLHPGSVVVDVGAGTGIASRLFARRGIQVIGIEPNADMRAQAEREALPSGVPAPSYRNGRAEATGLDSGSSDAVLCAQAFHWFETDQALAEFHRVLKPGGWVILLGYERDEAEPFTRQYGDLLRRLTDAETIERPRQRASEALFLSSLFDRAETTRFPYIQELDEQAFLGRSLSISYAPSDPEPLAAYRQALAELFAAGRQQGQVVLRYETSVATARRRERLVS